MPVPVWMAVLAAPAVLAAGTAAEFTLGVGETRRHLLPLEAGQLVQVEVREKSARAILTLRDPMGGEVARRQAAEWATTFRLLAVAQVGGVHVIDVQAFGRDGPGRYEIDVAAPRPRREGDGTLLAADEDMAAAVRDVADATPEAWQRAVARLADAEAGFAAAGDARGEAVALTTRAFIRLTGGDPLAEAMFDRALAAFAASGDRRGQAAAMLGLGQARARRGLRAEALALYDQAAAVAEALGDRRALAQHLVSAGVLQERMGQAEAALESYSRSLAAATQGGSRRGEARALNNLGVVYQDLGEYRKARDLYERALPLQRAAGSRIGEVIALGNLSNIHYALEDDAQALAFFEQALPLAQALGVPAEEAHLLKNASKVFARRGDHARALDSALRSLELWRQSGERSGEAEALRVLGRRLHEGGELEAAAERFHEALRLERAHAERFLEAELLFDLARLERDRGRLREAVAHAESCIRLTEALREAVTNPELRGSFQAAEEDKYGLLIDLLMRRHEQEPAAGHDAAALQVSERARGRLLLEALIEARADVRQGVDPELLAAERAAQKRLHDAATALSRVLAREGAPDEGAAARRALDEATAEHGQVQARIRRRSPRYAELTQPEPATTDEIRRDLLDAETVLIEFYLGDERSFLWALTTSELVSHALPPRAAIEPAARRVHDLLAARQRTRLPAAAREADRQLESESRALSRLLLGGIASRLASGWKGKRLLVVAAGAVAYLPIAALPSPADVTRPLLLDHEVVFAPSASVMVALRRDPAAPLAWSASTLAVLADPVFDRVDPRVGDRSAPADPPAPGRAGLTRALDSLGKNGFSRLPFSRREADAIAALLPRVSLLKATDFDASRSLVVEGGLEDRRIVHFATHGLVNSQHPELSGLVLSLVDKEGAPRNGFLRMHEIYNLRLPADLVVLSACQTALGREIRGEGLIGLTRGFMYAGARRVVASLWQVDDESTAELMKRFYRGMLKEGRRPPEALRTAQLELARHPRWSAPFYWAGFVLQGEWR
jgi:CHAT domain-containing protein/tetratricopeptide (TPR) repeat protein